MSDQSFKCLDCGHTFTALLPAGQMEEVKCLECGHPETEKLLPPGEEPLELSAKPEKE